MLVNVKMLIIISMSFLISACSGKLIYVPTACNIKSIDRSVIDYSDKGDILDASKRCSRNYTAVKEENELLRATIEVCR